METLNYCTERAFSTGRELREAARIATREFSRGLVIVICRRDLSGVVRGMLLFACALFIRSALAGTPQKAPESGLVISSTARLLAGLAPMDPEQADFAQSEVWRKYSARLQASWDRLQQEQVAPLKAWRDANLPQGCPVGSTLLYPFSGPDFFNAYWLFPDCDTYVFFGLEHVGDVPVVKGMTEKQFAHLLGSVHDAMANLFARNYFITSKMGTTLRNADLHGVLPIIMVSMAFAGIDVERVEPLVLAPLPRSDSSHRTDAGPPVLRHAEGVTIKFRRSGSQRTQTLRYFSVDASNAGAVRYPEFFAYLRGLAPTTTLIKSASYLLHANIFKSMRNVLLDATGFLVQDDTGLPFGILLKRGWNVRVFGRYVVPIRPFEGYYQQALADLYGKQKPERLSFRFGYRASPRDDRSNLMVGNPAPGTASNPGKGSTGSAAVAPISRR